MKVRACVSAISFTAIILAAILIAAILIAPAAAQEKGRAPTGQAGQWVPGLYLNISMGCLKKWICDCSGVKPPRGARLVRTPSERTAGICKAGARGECTICTADRPEKKCACEVKPR